MTRRIAGRFQSEKYHDLYTYKSRLLRLHRILYSAPMFAGSSYGFSGPTPYGIDPDFAKTVSSIASGSNTGFDTVTDMIALGSQGQDSLKTDATGVKGPNEDMINTLSGMPSASSGQSAARVDPSEAIAATVTAGLRTPGREELSMYQYNVRQRQLALKKRGEQEETRVYGATALHKEMNRLAKETATKEAKALKKFAQEQSPELYWTQGQSAAFRARFPHIPLPDLGQLRAIADTIIAAPKGQAEEMMSEMVAKAPSTLPRKRISQFTAYGPVWDRWVRQFTTGAPPSAEPRVPLQEVIKGMMAQTGDPGLMELKPQSERFYGQGVKPKKATRKRKY
jgi:hypothetical protein